MQRHLGVLIGTVLALAVIAGMTELNLVLFAWPDFDWSSPQAWGDTIAAAPMTAQAMIAGSWPIAALVGGLIAVRIADWASAGWIVAVVLAVAGGVTALMVPQPLWMQLTALIAPVLAGVVVAGAAGAA